MRSLAFIAGCVVLLIALGKPCQSQNPRLTPPFAVGNHDEDARLQAEIKRKQEKALNLQRQQQIKKDTDQLLKLATELKQYMDKTNENTLSIDVVRKADEIEKLARQVKEKMKSGT